MYSEGNLGTMHGKPTVRTRMMGILFVLVCFTREIALRNSITRPKNAVLRSVIILLEKGFFLNIQIKVYF
jgi:hypothetical protein